MRQFAIALLAAVLLAGCCQPAFLRGSAITTTYDDSDVCPACGNAAFDIHYQPAGSFFVLNGRLVSYDCPMLKMRCEVCGFEKVCRSEVYHSHSKADLADPAEGWTEDMVRP